MWHVMFGLEYYLLGLNGVMFSCLAPPFPRRYPRSVFPDNERAGITPMLQVLQEVTFNPEDKTKVTLIFANKSPSDIMLKEELDKLESEYDNVKIVYLVRTTTNLLWRFLSYSRHWNWLAEGEAVQCIGNLHRRSCCRSNNRLAPCCNRIPPDAFMPRWW